jgi:transcriptional regulator with XRE-family HTH domain
MKREELLVASHLVGLGITGGAAFCFMRKIHGLRAVDLAALLDVTGETISRWETDKVPVPRCVLSTMTALAADKLVGKTDTIDRLRAMASGKTPARGMKIELKMAS